MRSNQKIIIWLLNLFLVQMILTACMPLHQEYKVPQETGDDWTTASLEDVGMMREPIDEMFSFLSEADHHSINSVLVVKNGKLVLEAYYPGDDFAIGDELKFTEKSFTRDDLHFQASVSKSMTSLLFGIAMDRGSISDLDEKIFESFPEYRALNSDEKGDITLRHLLTMTDGFTWDEEAYPYTDHRNVLTQMYYSTDPFNYILEKPLMNLPGEKFNYQSGTTNLLGEIIQRKTGSSLEDYAGKTLFAPLGITEYHWDGYYHFPESAMASSLLYLKPRDMAKIGQMVLQEGEWEGEQIISREWIHEATAEQIQLSKMLSPVFEETGYGYQWWRGKFSNGNTDVIFAGGWGGQFIFIIPDLDMVVVLTGSDFSGNYTVPLGVVNQYILGAVYGNEQSENDFSYGVTLFVPVDTEDMISMHSGPGIEFAITGEVRKGVEYQITEWKPGESLDQAWLQIEDVGWIPLSAVDLLSHGVIDINDASADDFWVKGNFANLPVYSAPPDGKNFFQRNWFIFFIIISTASILLAYWIRKQQRKILSSDVV